MSQQPYLRPDAIIYLKTSPTTCRSRVLMRNRHEEIATVTPRYLDLLHKHFERWIATMDPMDVLILDGDQDFESDARIAKELVRRIEAFLVTLVGE
jgi:deoxyadenosine/deoxycytidine kinase